jgi:tRNA(Ile)-lysidine synthase TilS/MesJ
MKKLVYRRQYKQVFQKDKVYTKTFTPCLHYLDVDEGIENQESIEIDNFDEYCDYLKSLHVKNTLCEWFDDGDHLVTRKNFRRAKISTYYTEMPKTWSICQIMRELPYQEFIEFCKDNGVAVTL